MVDTNMAKAALETKAVPENVGARTMLNSITNSKAQPCSKTFQSNRQHFVQKHSYSEAIAEFQKAIELSGGSISARANLAYAYALSNKRNEAVKILNDLKTRSTRNAAEIALMYVGLGEKDQAMTWLEKAYDEHFNPSILVRPAFDPLRSDPRFQNLVHRVGLAG